MTLDALLQPYRTDDSLGVVTVIDDVPAKKLLAAWPRYNPRWVRPKGRMPSDLDERWYWLWEGVDVDVRFLAECANISEHVAGPKLLTCIHARLLFPDGTLSKAATMMLNAFIAQNLPPAPKKSPGRPKKKES
jgi:hypothetical protein